MDIARMSMVLSQSQIQQQVSLSLMKKTMEQTKENGDFVSQMLQGASIQSLQHAAQPHLGGNIDLKL